MHFPLLFAQVYTNEGKATADKFGCIFFETSVSESSNDVHEVFWAIFNELKSTRSNAFRRLRKFSVTKIMTLLFGKEYSRMAPNAQSGTVTVLKKDELSKTLEVKWTQSLAEISTNSRPLWDCQRDNYLVQ